jgi:broad specificity phosphatase PhoE
MTVRRLLLVRHGQTAYNEERRFTGWADPPLTTHGRAQARALGRRIRGEAIDAVYSSDLRRAADTAAVAIRHTSLQPRDVVTDPSLREASFGEWQGLTFAEARQRDPASAEALIKRSIDFRAPGGESISEVHERLSVFQRRLHAAHDGATILVVASGGPVQILIAGLFGMPIESHWRLAVDNCSLSIVNFVQEEPFLALLNDRSHLTRPRPSAESSVAAPGGSKQHGG